MTQPRTAPRTQPASKHDDDDPQALHAAVAALAAFFWLIAMATIMRFTHVPGWIALLVHTVIGVALAVAGFSRKPRALSLRSVVYRFVSLFLAGQWLFWNVADVGDGGQQVLAMVCQFLLAGVVIAVVYFGCRAGFWKLALGSAALLLLIGEITIVALTGAYGGGAGEWIAHVMTTTAPLTKANYLPWLWPGAIIGAGTMCTVGAILGLIFANHEQDEDDKKELAQLLRTTTREQQAMTALIQEFGRDKRLQCIDVKKWDNGAGETYEINTAAAGMDWRDLAQYCNAIASRLFLPRGCGVEHAEGRNRGLGMLHVTRVNKLAEHHNYPLNELKPRNIYEGLPIGVLRPGDQVCIEIRENGVIVIGQKRSGKTLLLDGAMASLGQCVDTLIWVIDFNGGGVALPYLYAWAEGRVDRPMIDWVADDENEALRMAKTALNIALDRKQHYKARKKTAGVNLLPIDKDLPQIVIVLDEGAEAMGESTSVVAAQVRETLEKLQRVAGDSGFNVFYSFLRATSDAVNPAVKKQSPIRVAMRVSDPEELAYLFGEWKMNPADTPDQGMGFIQTGHGTGTRVFKGYYLDPPMMDQIAVKTASWRPYMDLQGRRVGGDIYRDRWVRMQRLLWLDDGKVRGDLNLDVDANAPMTPAPGGIRAGDMAAAQATPAQPAPEGPGAAATATATLPDPDKLSRRRRVAGMDSDDIEDRTDSVRDGLRRLSGGGGPDDAFSAIVEREFGEPAGWPDGSVARPVDGEPPSASPTVVDGGGDVAGRRSVLERIVLEHGPIGRTALWKKLQEAGFEVSMPTLDKDLKQAPWVAQRENGQPYDHIRRQGNAQT